MPIGARLHIQGLAPFFVFSFAGKKIYRTFAADYKKMKEFAITEAKVETAAIVGLPLQNKQDIVDKNIAKVTALCEQYKVKSLFVFGSVLTDKFHKDSDVDLLVDFKKSDIHDYFDNFFGLKYALESVFGRKVDLVEAAGIRNPYFSKQVDASKVRIYG